MGTNEQIAKLILQQTWEEREAMGNDLWKYDWEDTLGSEILGTWASQLLEAAKQPKPEPAAQDDDGWIEWQGGGRCPVALDALVTVRLRSGIILDHYKRAGSYRWFHYSGSADDIIAYKVIKP